MQVLGSSGESHYAMFNLTAGDTKVHTLKVSEIFKEGSDARRAFGKLYAVAAIGVIITVLVLLALATRGG